MADAADAISSAMKSGFPDSFLLTCYFHVKQAVDRQIKYSPKDFHKERIKDLKKLHMIRNEKYFKEVWDRINAKCNLNELIQK